MEGFTLSYAACGEDLILKTIFGKGRRDGFYIDIGCNKPIQNSNTFKLYLKGWSGICIDGNAGLVKKFKRIRKRDICLTEIVSGERREVIFYQDDVHHTLSTVDSAVGNALKSGSGSVKEIRRHSRTLESILEQHLFGTRIDLLSIDVERHDLEVLKGNDFEKYRPQIICTEWGGDPGSLKGTEVDVFLTGRGYEMLVFSSPNVFYVDKKI